MIKLYLISQDKNNDYDTYDSAVVAARNEIEAAQIHPNSDTFDIVYDLNFDCWMWTIGTTTDATEYVPYRNDSWVEDPHDIEVKYLGEAADGIEVGVVCASFNAG